MKRFLNPALAAMTACASLSLAACGTESGTDGGSTADTSTAADTGGTISDTTSDTTAEGDAAKTDTATADVQPKDVQKGPCDDACKAGEKCDTKTNKCYVPCEGKCTAAQYCDETAGAPGTCKDTAALPTKWGVGDDGKAQKVVKLAITDTAKACDMNGDGKPDNALAGAKSLIGSNLQDAVKKGDVVLLFEPKTYATDGSKFSFNVLIGDTEASNMDPLAAGGKYTVKKESYDPATGKSLVAFTDATIKGGTLTAKADKFFLNLSISGINLALTISAVQFTGTTTSDKTWDTTTGGILCGYITEADLNGAIDALPPEMLAQFGGKDAVKKLLPTLIKSDVDSDKDGKADAKSLALDIDTLGGIITGFTAPKAP